MCIRDRYSVRDFISGLVADAIFLLSGLVHTVLIFTGTSSAGFNPTLQVRVSEDPDRIVLPGVSVTRLTAGWETVNK